MGSPRVLLFNSDLIFSLTHQVFLGLYCLIQIAKYFSFAPERSRCDIVFWLILLQVSTMGLSRAECTSAARQVTVCLWSRLVSPEDPPPWTQNRRLWSDRTQRRTSFLRNGRDPRVVLRSSAYGWTAGWPVHSSLWADVFFRRFLKHIWPVHLMKVYPNYCPLNIHYAHSQIF